MKGFRQGKVNRGFTHEQGVIQSVNEDVVELECIK